MSAAVQLPLADPAEQPGKVRFGCVRLRCSTSVEWCGARSKRSKTIGQACYGCELGKGHEQYAGEPVPKYLRDAAARSTQESKRERAIRDVDALRNAAVRDAKPAKRKRKPRPKRPPIEVRDPIEVGREFGFWVVLGEGERRRGRRTVLLRCKCGYESSPLWSAMKCASTRSKGCRSCVAYAKGGRRTLTHRGKSQHLQAWARETGINARTIAERIRDGWTVAQALDTPVQPHSPVANPRSRPCRGCGGPKDRGKGSSYCTNCMEARA